MKNKKIKIKRHLVLPLATLIRYIYPKIEIDLREANIEKSAKEYISSIIFRSLLFFLSLSFLSIVISYYTNNIKKLPLVIATLLGLTLIIMVAQLFRPKFKVAKWAK